MEEIDIVEIPYSFCGGFDETRDLQSNVRQENMAMESVQPRMLTDISHSNIDDFNKISAENDLRDLLKTWNQENLADCLIDQNVLVPVLKVIKRHHIERLLKKFDMGTQIMFEHNLENWRNAIELPLSNQCEGNSHVKFSSALSNFSSPSSSNSDSPRENTPIHFMPYHKTDTTNEYLSLAKILESPKGLMLTEYYTKFTVFQEEQRILLVALIANRYDETSVPLSLASSHRLEKEILERFPTEKLEYYRVAKRGKIYNKFCNIKASFKSAVSSHVLPPKTKIAEKVSRHVNDFQPEVDAESCLRCLRFDNLSVEEFDVCWKACARYRLLQIKEMASTSSFMETWPFYKYPSGYRLIDIDFKICFENKDGLLMNWDNYRDNLIKFLSSNVHVKDKKIKALIETVRDTADLPENGKNAAIFWALHGYLVPTKLIITKKGDKKTSTRYTIADSQTAFMYLAKSLQQMEDHILHMKNSKTAIQPFIYCVGEDILNIKEITIYFDDIRYNFNNFLRAADICFKIMYLFDLDFPQQCITFYSFIESFFYNFKSKYGTSKIHILSDYLKNHKDA